MSQKYVIACDLGTSGLKVVLVSMEGRILSTVTENYGLFTNSLNHAEQVPDEYWDAACRGFRSVRGTEFRGEDCAGIAFGTQWKGIIPIDAQGRVLHNSIIWMDKRASEEAAALNDAFGKTLFCEGDYWPKLAWLRKHKPEAYENSVMILEANAFLKWKATGKAVSDVTNCYTRAYSAQKQAFYDDVLRYAGLDPEKFPPLCKSTDLVGELTEEAAAQLDLPCGVPVFGGCCDIPALAIGSGCSSRGSAHAYLGTSGWLGCIAPHNPDEVYCPPLDPDNDVSFYGLGVSVGPSTQWLLDTFYSAEQQQYGKQIWDFINEEVGSTPPGAARLLAAPWFFGGRPPYSSGAARGVFINLGSKHTRAHMMRALLESFCYIMRQNVERLNAASGTPLDSLTVCGGGTSNPHWMQAMADILQIDVKVPQETRSTGAIGVAYCALIGLGVVESFEKLQEHVTIETVYHPRKEYAAEYDLLFRQFETLYGSLQTVFEALN